MLIWAFDILYLGFTLLSSPVWIWRLVRTGKWRTDWRGRFGHADALAPVAGVRTVLIHAVSVGEVNAIRDLATELHRRHGDSIRIVISTTTDTGTDRVQALFSDRHTVVRYPLDFSWMVRRFLNRIRPDAVILVELEVWPNFMNLCARRDIPVAVINGRLSERSYRRYLKVRGLMYRAFASIQNAAVQDEAYAQRFAGMGVPQDRVHVTGSMKWDTAQIADTVEGSDALAQAMGIDRSRPLIVCGSTGPDEEKQIVQVLASLQVQLMFAPAQA